MHLHWVILFTALTIVLGQSNLTATPLSLRGIWCLAKLSQSPETYTQIGQVFFYNNGTFTFNYLDNPSDTLINHLVAVNNTDGGNGTYQLFSVATKGHAQVVNKTLCFWRHRVANGDIIPGRQSNGTCTSTFEPDTSSDAVIFTRRPTTCRLIDDENTQLVISNTSFEVGTLLNFDRMLSSAIKKGVVFFGSSSIVKWTTLAQDFPDYTTLNRGFGGSTLLEGYKEFKRIVYPLEPSVLVIYSGENDIGEGATPAEVQDVFRQLIPLIRRFYPNLPIAYISIKPTPARVAKIALMNEANLRIRGDIDTMFPGVTFINIWPFMILPNGLPNPDLFGPDNEHMNSKGYAIWTKAVTSYLESV